MNSRLKMYIRGLSYCFGLIAAFTTSKQIHFSSGFLCSDVVIRLKGGSSQNNSVLMFTLWRLKCSSFEEIKDVTHTLGSVLDAQRPGPQVERITEYKS